MGEDLMVVLDSDFLVAMLRGNEEAKKFQQTLDQSESTYFTTVINAYELLVGAHLHFRAQENLNAVQDLLAHLTILPMTAPAVSIAARITAHLSREGTPIDVQDVYIAAIALAHGQDIVSRNKRDFDRIPDVNVRAW